MPGPRGDNHSTRSCVSNDSRRFAINSSEPLALLRGVRILSFTQFLLGPAGVQYLADMGAAVIQIEPPGAKLFERTWAGCDHFISGVWRFRAASGRSRS